MAAIGKPTDWPSRRFPDRHSRLCWSGNRQRTGVQHCQAAYRLPSKQLDGEGHTQTL